MPTFLVWTLVSLLFAGVPSLAFAADEDASGPAVKRSRSGVCHLRGEYNYQQTTNYTPFDSLEACLASGGRRPGAKAAGPPAGEAEDLALYDTDDTSIVKKSRSGICHDAQSPSYRQVLSFTAYRTMDDCIKSGGRSPAN